jgi:hypothetical protein
MDSWSGTRAPRGADEIATVLTGRPPGWEYLYFAGNLLAGRDAVEESFRKHVTRSSSPADERVADDAAVDHLQRAIGDLQQIVASLTPLFGHDVFTAAFAPPGQAGDPIRIRQLAERWTNVYELLLDWARRLRSADPSDTYRPLFESLAQLADRPVREYHDFVDGFVANVDRNPGCTGLRRSPQHQHDLDPNARRCGSRSFFRGIERTSTAASWVRAGVGQSGVTRITRGVRRSSEPVGSPDQPAVNARTCRETSSKRRSARSSDTVVGASHARLAATAPRAVAPIAGPAMNQSNRTLLGSK